MSGESWRLANSHQLMHNSFIGVTNGDCVMSNDHEPGADDDSAEQSQEPTRREALGRFAQYTAPIMLAMLLSEQAGATSLT
jgi:hypothetical protein